MSHSFLISKDGGGLRITGRGTLSHSDHAAILAGIRRELLLHRIWPERDHVRLSDRSFSGDGTHNGSWHRGSHREGWGIHRCFRLPLPAAQIWFADSDGACRYRLTRRPGTHHLHPAEPNQRSLEDISDEHNVRAAHQEQVPVLV